MSRTRYIELCRNREDLPLFAQPWWWDALAPGWEAIVLKLPDGKEAAIPYWLHQRMGIRFLRNPHLIPYVSLISSETITSAVTEKMLKALPQAGVIALDFNPLQAFDLSEKKVRHTRILALNNSTEELFRALASPLQRQIRKAERLGLTVQECDTAEFLRLYHLSFERQGRKPAVPDIAFESAAAVCREHQCGKILCMRDPEGRNLAAVFWVYDRDRAYYLSGGSDPDYLQSGAMSTLLWEAIKRSKAQGQKQFDFEGSDHPGIDRFFRNFEASQVPYLHLGKERSLLYKAYRMVRPH